MSEASSQELTAEQKSLMGKLMFFCLSNKLVVALVVVFVIGWGIIVAPFDWEVGGLMRKPVPVDAIPDIGENQQIVFTEWMGRSPQDVEDQISYPLTVSLLGVPGVKTIRSYSFFGFSSIYIIFKENIEFYWSRSRVLEKLNSLPAGTLPEGVQPALGPDATALGQIFWYTLEGRDLQGNPCGGWDLEELRTIQDWYVRYGLLAADGVSEVASVGGFVREYQVDVDPDAMRAYNVTFADVYAAVKGSNIDVGAKTLELSRVEYFIRGVGFIKEVSDIEDSVVRVTDNVPVLVKNVATVTLGPAMRRGALDKEGAEVAGGVVIARYGDNPLAAIKNVKKKIAEISPGLPSKVHIDFSKVTAEQVRLYVKEHDFESYSDSELNQDAWLTHLRETPQENWPAWATISQVNIVPFYDRTGLIYETLGTLFGALSEEILITVIVVILMVMHLRSSILISGLLPIAVLMCFIAMKFFGVDANIVALSGIAIAIGTMVDMGIVICENILRHLDEAPPEANRLMVIHRAASEVGSAVLTAVSTTVVSFLPVFTMIGAEGKLFKPLAFTKTFALIASVVVALTIIPPAAHLLFCARTSLTGKKIRLTLHLLLVLVGVSAGFLLNWWAGVALIFFGVYYLIRDYVPQSLLRFAPCVANLLAVLFVAVLLSGHWEPVGPERGLLRNFVFVAGLVAGLLGFFRIFQHFYPSILRWCLRHKLAFLSIPCFLLLLGGSIWLGFDTVFDGVPAAASRLGIEPEKVRETTFWVNATEAFPGLGKEFMPPLDEGSFLLMPTTMVHASIGEAMDVLSKQDMALRSISEVDTVVGKIGRAETSLDPAPISMIETVINYKPEYITDKDGHRVRFRYDKRAGQFVRDDYGELIADSSGRPYRQWRDHIKSPDDIWAEILKAAEIQGTTSAPKLQPIAARIVMLQSGMRAPMGVKIKGPTLEIIEKVGLEIEQFLKQVPSVEPAAVIADRVVGKPYLEIVPDRKALARYGVRMRAFQDVVEIAIGGRRITTTVEGRERFPVRVRYQRELRDEIETMKRILVPGSDGAQIPLVELAEIRYVRGPQVIKSEDTFLTGYVLFDMKTGMAEVDVVEECQRYLQDKIDEGQFVLPPGVSYSFAGSYENQIRSQKTLAVVLPVALFIIFLILYFQFKSVITTSLVFSGILVAWSGGFLMLWLYGQPWFLDFGVFGLNIRDLFQIHPINLSVAVWVGFLALFGIASDDGVVMGTYLEQSFRDHKTDTKEGIREATVLAGKRRIRACLMTTATTILALLPVLTSTGRGSDVMVPMAIPSFGGMTIEVLTMLIVPVLYCMIQEFKLKVSVQ
ncbi:MAG: efflux RND transporter permease subunit [Planctomycetota bacterium]|jgi:Cu(I)/Ag(I) efflux system membrane protein CusA/SilA